MLPFFNKAWNTWNTSGPYFIRQGWVVFKCIKHFKERCLIKTISLFTIHICHRLFFWQTPEFILVVFFFLLKCFTMRLASSGYCKHNMVKTFLCKKGCRSNIKNRSMTIILSLWAVQFLYEIGIMQARGIMQVREV